MPLIKKRQTEEETLELIRNCARFLDEKKMRDIKVLDLKPVNSYFDFFIIATGSSSLQGRSLTRELVRRYAQMGLRCYNRPDLNSPWIILDFNHFIVHIFSEEARDYYQLEKLWSDAPVVEY